MGEADRTARKALIAELQAIVGAAHIVTDPGAMQRFTSGFRFGGGPALAVVQPASLVEQWRILQRCVAHRVVVIMQAANTGLTGGSTPDGDDYDRDVILISTLRMDRIHVIEEGRQVICLPGATLFQLERSLAPFGREPHSVIGSSCFGASVIGGICNNSGGSLVRRGPAFTQLALFARVREDGEIELVNHLGVHLGTDPEAMLKRLEEAAFSTEDVEAAGDRLAADTDYATHVRDVDADTPARFNADPRRLFEASGSAGKIMLFAVRLDTFPRDAGGRVFYIGTNDPDELTAIRRHVLSRFAELPIAGEYLHREAFDIAARYGKDMFLAIRHLGTDRLPALFALKAKLDRWAKRSRLFGPDPTDRMMQMASRLVPDHLPPRMRACRDRFEHHLLLKVGPHGLDEARDYLSQTFPSAQGDMFECTDAEGDKAFLHRFVTAGAAVRYRSVHARAVEDIVAVDVALRRNDDDWLERLPEALQGKIVHKLYYGHFLCHVLHQDYVVKRGHDPRQFEHDICAGLDARGARYPAEHNVGHLYPAEPALLDHYRQLDPVNMFNPGIGKTSKRAHWAAGSRGA